MAALDTINQLEAKVQDQLDKASEVKAQLEADVALHEQLKSEVAGELQAAELAGIEKGKAMIQLPDPQNPDAQYTQAQLEEAVKAGQEVTKLELQPQIDALKAELEKMDAALVAKNEELAKEHEALLAKEQEMADYKAKVQAELDQDKAALA